MLSLAKRVSVITLAIVFAIIAFSLVAILASLKLIRTLLPAVATFFLVWSIYELHQNREMCCLIALGYAAVFLLLAVDSKLDVIKGEKDQLTALMDRIIGWFDDRVKEKAKYEQPGQQILQGASFAKHVH